MKEKKKWLVTIEIQEDHEYTKHYEDIVVFDSVEIGATFRGGKVISCNQLKRID